MSDSLFDIVQKAKQSKNAPPEVDPRMAKVIGDLSNAPMVGKAFQPLAQDLDTQVRFSAWTKQNAWNSLGRSAKTEALRSAAKQAVGRADSALYDRLLKEFYKISGTPLVVKPDFPAYEPPKIQRLNPINQSKIDAIDGSMGLGSKEEQDYLDYTGGDPRLSRPQLSGLTGRPNRSVYQTDPLRAALKDKGVTMGLASNIAAGLMRGQKMSPIDIAAELEDPFYQTSDNALGLVTGLIPGINAFTGIEMGATITGDATNRGLVPAITDFGTGMLQSVNPFESGISPYERLVRGAGLAGLGLGAGHVASRGRRMVGEAAYNNSGTLEALQRMGLADRLAPEAMRSSRVEGGLPFDLHPELSRYVDRATKALSPEEKLDLGFLRANGRENFEQRRASSVGARVEYVDQLGEQDGMPLQGSYSGGVIKLIKDGKDPSQHSTHELLHHVENQLGLEPGRFKSFFTQEEWTQMKDDAAWLVKSEFKRKGYNEEVIGKAQKYLTKDDEIARFLLDRYLEDPRLLNSSDPLRGVKELFETSGADKAAALKIDFEKAKMFGDVQNTGFADLFGKKPLQVEEQTAPKLVRIQNDTNGRGYDVDYDTASKWDAAQTRFQAVRESGDRVAIMNAGKERAKVWREIEGGQADAPLTGDEVKFTGPGKVRSYRHAKAVEAAAGGRDYDGVKDPAVFRKAIDENQMGRTLTPYTLDDIAKMEVFKNPEAESYYAIKQVEKHEFTGQAERDLVGVMNNGDQTKGVGAGAVLDALEKGATTLDAFDGFLPNFYSKFGFSEIARVYFDPKYVDSDLFGMLDDLQKGRFNFYGRGGEKFTATRADLDRFELQSVPTDKPDSYGNTEKFRYVYKETGEPASDVLPDVVYMKFDEGLDRKTARNTFAREGRLQRGGVEPDASVAQERGVPATEGSPSVYGESVRPEGSETLSRDLRYVEQVNSARDLLKSRGEDPQFSVDFWEGRPQKQRGIANQFYSALEDLLERKLPGTLSDVPERSVPGRVFPDREITLPSGEKKIIPGKREADKFYSAESIKDQVIKLVANAEGVTEEEVIYSNLGAVLDELTEGGGKLDKATLIDRLQQERPVLYETRLSGTKPNEERIRVAADEAARRYVEEHPFDATMHWEDLKSDLEQVDGISWEGDMVKITMDPQSYLERVNQVPPEVTGSGGGVVDYRMQLEIGDDGRLTATWLKKMHGWAEESPVWTVLADKNYGQMFKQMRDGGIPDSSVFPEGEIAKPTLLKLGHTAGFELEGVMNIFEQLVQNGEFVKPIRAKMDLENATIYHSDVVDFVRFASDEAADAYDKIDDFLRDPWNSLSYEEQASIAQSEYEYLLQDAQDNGGVADGADGVNQYGLGGETGYLSLHTPGGDGYTEILLNYDQDQAWRSEHGKYNVSYLSNHFENAPVDDGRQTGDHNLIAHTRFDRRGATDSAGVYHNALFIDEIQSDLHQDARKKGYRGENEAKVKDKNALFAQKRSELVSLLDPVMSSYQWKEFRNVSYRITEKLSELRERDINPATESRATMARLRISQALDTLSEEAVMSNDPLKDRFATRLAYDAQEQLMRISQNLYEHIQFEGSRAEADVFHELAREFDSFIRDLDSLLSNQGYYRKRNELEQIAVGAYTPDGVPDAPFKSSQAWMGVMLRKLIREAAESGQEAIVWLDGQGHAQRYNNTLQDGLDRLEVSKDPSSASGEYQRWVLNGQKEGRQILDRVIGNSELERYLPDEMARKARMQTDADPSVVAVFEGENISVGDGKGFAKAYDQILPNVAAKYLKKYGIILEQFTVREVGRPLYGFKMNDTLRKAALEEGQPMFQGSVEFGEPSRSPKPKKSLIGRVLEGLGMKSRSPYREIKKDAGNKVMGDDIPDVVKDVSNPESVEPGPKKREKISAKIPREEAPRTLTDDERNDPTMGEKTRLREWLKDGEEKGIVFRGKPYRSWEEAKRVADLEQWKQNISDRLSDKDLNMGEGISDVEQAMARTRALDLEAKMTELTEKMDQARADGNDAELSLYQQMFDDAFAEYSQLAGDVVDLKSNNGRALAASKMFSSMFEGDAEKALRTAKAIARRKLKKPEQERIVRESRNVEKAQKAVDLERQQRREKAVSVLKNEAQSLKGRKITLKDLESC